jgi:FkbM family methyltransferase
MNLDNYYQNAVLVNELGRSMSSFDRRVEDGTRYLAKKYINNTDKVLELGARFGTVSIYLDKILNNPSIQLLCVEPDSNVINAIEQNKINNNCSFNIFNGTISNDELYVVYNGCGWETKTYKVPPSNLKSIKCNTKSMNQIIDEYNINFNVLVADCEGFLLEFIQNNIDFINGLNTIIYEEDCNKKHPINGIYIDYEQVNNILTNLGFQLSETFIDHIGLANKCWKKI